MPRRRRGLMDHACYHVTHRCHGRQFLFRFAKDRERYVTLLRETTRRFKISVLNYVVTSNHVHLLMWVRKGPELSRAMQFLQGEFGQYYNKRKNREGAFWRDRYHSTLIESGEHLGRCVFYIDLNMVRAGVVDHPGVWRHCGYHELVGKRQRYRAVDLDRLLRCLGMRDVDQFRRWYARTLTEKLASGVGVREAYWTEAFAVGSEEWVQDIYQRSGFKRKKILSSPVVVYDHGAGASNGNGIAEAPSAWYIEG